MTSRANIDEPERLLEVGTSLEAAVRSGEQSLRTAQAVLADRRRRLREAAAEAGRAVAAAEEALVRSDDDDDGDVGRAQSRLDEARTRLTIARDRSRRLEDVAARYEASARRLRSVLANEMRDGVASLQHRLSLLEPYFRQRPAVFAAWHAFTGGGHHPRQHGWSFEKAKQSMLQHALVDPLTPRWVRGWIQSEVHRREVAARAVAAGQRPPGGNRRRLRMPPGLQAGHRIPGLDTRQNLRFEDAALNMGRPGRARRLGLGERLR